MPTALKRFNWFFPDGDAGVAVDAADPGGGDRSLKFDLSLWPWPGSGGPVGPVIVSRVGNNESVDQSAEFNLKSSLVAGPDMDIGCLLRAREPVGPIIALKHLGNSILPIIIHGGGPTGTFLLSFVEGPGSIDANTTEWWRPRLTVLDQVVADGQAYDGTYTRVRIDRKVGAEYFILIDTLLKDTSEVGQTGGQALNPSHGTTGANWAKINDWSVTDIVPTLPVGWPFSLDLDAAGDWRAQSFVRGAPVGAYTNVITAAAGPHGQSNVMRITNVSPGAETILHPIQWLNTSGRNTLFFKAPADNSMSIRLTPFGAIGAGTLNGHALLIDRVAGDLTAKIVAAFNAPDATVLDMGNVASFVVGDWYGVEFDMVSGVTEPTVTARIEHIGTSPMTQIGSVLDNISGVGASLNDSVGMPQFSVTTDGQVDIGEFDGAIL